MKKSPVERVLVVDDEPQVLVALNDLLSEEFIVLRTDSPERALSVIESEADIAVVVSDELMPRMSGAELFARIPESSSARRILLTGYADLAAVVRAVNDGKIFSYVTKPWDEHDLKQKVRQAAEQFRLVRELASEQQLLRDLMDNTPDGIYFTDREHRIRSANRSFAALIGVANPEALIGKTLLEANPKFPQLDLIAKEEAAIWASGQASLDVVRNHSTPGRPRFISETKAPIRDPQGNVLGIVGIARDVTDRIQLGENLRESEARLREHTRLLNAILNSMREAVMVSDREGSLVALNQRAQSMFGGLPLGTSAAAWASEYQVTHPDTEQKLPQDPVLMALTGNEVTDVEVAIGRATPTEAVWSITGTPLRDENNTVIGGVALLRDVTDKRVLIRQLAQAQKMEAIGRLAGGVAHDFNNLLSVITAYAEFAQRRMAPNDPGRDDIGEVLAASERAARLTRQLVAISTKEIVRPEILQLNDVVRNLHRMLSRVIGENIAVTTALEPSLYPVKLDVSQIEQVLLNLAVNARDAMPGGGRLAFVTKNVELDMPIASPFVQIPCGQYVLLSVVDTGAGMTPETAKRIFEPFFTTKRIGEGTGLGLATVYGIVQQSGGFIDVHSELGHGTTFEIYLPQADHLVHERSTRHSSAPPRVKPSATVLLVEDNDLVRRASSRILRAEGHVVLECSLPSEALKIAETSGTEVDLLLADVVLPEMSGIELAKQLCEKFGSMRLLLMSGNPGQSRLNEELLNTEVAFVQKPFSPDSLAREVSTLLERTQDNDPSS